MPRLSISGEGKGNQAYVQGGGLHGPDKTQADRLLGLFLLSVNDCSGPAHEEKCAIVSQAKDRHQNNHSGRGRKNTLPLATALSQMARIFTHFWWCVSDFLCHPKRWLPLCLVIGRIRSALSLQSRLFQCM